MSKIIVEGMRLKAELLRVQTAKAEMEYVIAQRLEEVERLKDNILNQEKAETELKVKLEAHK
jgi:hypothetical protein